MDIRTFVPDESSSSPVACTVIAWQMPTGIGRITPASPVVAGAFMHSFQMREGGATAVVRMHAKARSLRQLRDTRKWSLTPLSSTAQGEVHILCEPVPHGTPVTVAQLRLGLLPGGKMLLWFESVIRPGSKTKELAQTAGRRNRRALTDAQRIFA